ncbi:hypothetical protein LCL86_14180 [Muricauda ruestringensis]|uniref:hypothetical protein n=1 Tax=Flagellimonas ruestringensis TaxID=111501 RepID=UPI001CD45DB6|nr:hypothetical protein [Allomuricauda ruestringensis]MCA0960202.1 hypothetical protein [Allomuricauda ruestringensis]
MLVALNNSMDQQAKLKLDMAVYLLGEINRLPTLYRNEDSKERFARMSSQRLKKIIYNYSDYLQFLTKNGFVEIVKNHSTDNKQCRAYQITDNYYADELVEYEIKNKILLRKFDVKGNDGNQEERNQLVLRTRPYLVQNFDEKLGMDIHSAHDEIEYLQNPYDQKKYVHAMQLISEWERKAWSYSINWSTDERLHSTLTRTNKSLRKHIRYEGESIVGLDLKTSQPYFLCAILKGICTWDIELLKRIGAYEFLGNELIEDLFDTIDISEAREFARIVLNEDLYQSLLEVIPVRFDEAGKPFRLVYDKSNWREPWKTKTYSSARDAMKEIVLLIFNCKSRYVTDEIKAFKESFPTVFNMIQMIKRSGMEFYRLLCHVEAFCLLDYVAKEFARKYSGVPLFSIHDSLVTVESKAELLSLFMQEELYELTGLKPSIEREDWLEVLIGEKEKVS